MKKLLLAVIIISISVFAQAQDKSPEARATSKVERLDKKLNLSDDQKAQIHDLFVDQSQKGNVDGKKLKSMTKDERKAFIQERKDQRSAFNEQLESLLTTEQLAIYKEKKEDRKGKKEGQKGKKKERKEDYKKGKKTKKGKEGKKDSGAMIQKKVNKLEESLQLNTEQKAQVKELMTEQHSAKVGKKAKKDWTPENRAANKETRKAAKADFDAKMKNILTAEQYATFQTLEKGRREKGRKRGSLKKKNKE